LLESLHDFFNHAASEIGAGLTADPADVAGKIKLPDGMTCASAAWRLRLARDKVSEAMEHEVNGRPALAQHVLHSVLPGVIADSDVASQMVDQATITKALSATLWTPTPATRARAWSPE
jgi:hypothetical protein